MLVPAFISFSYLITMSISDFIQIFCPFVFLFLDVKLMVVIMDDH